MLNDMLRGAIAQRVGNKNSAAPGVIGGLPFTNPGSRPNPSPVGGLPFVGVNPIQMPTLTHQPMMGRGNPSDPRGILGILSRGAPVYRGGSNSARMGGGPNIGRPSVGLPPEAISRRLGR